MTPTAAELRRQFQDVHAAIVAEVESWDGADLATPCGVHGEEADARRLALHLAARGSKVAALLEQRRFGQLTTEHLHSTPSKNEPSSAEILAALRSAGAATLHLINALTDDEIERLRGSDIDGEPDAIDASCGLLGHWKFHLPAIREVHGGKQ
jgi:hypothetical protein